MSEQTTIDRLPQLLEIIDRYLSELTRRLDSAKKPERTNYEENGMDIAPGGSCSRLATSTNSSLEILRYFLPFSVR
jgi:hypothetical protein